MEFSGESLIVKVIVTTACVRVYQMLFNSADRLCLVKTISNYMIILLVRLFGWCEQPPIKEENREVQLYFAINLNCLILKMKVKF